MSAGGGCRWRLAEASRDGRVSERETASAGGGHGACAGGGGADGARAVRAGRDECHGTHTYIYIAASQRRLAYTSHIKLQRTRAECTSGPQGQSVFFRPVTARPRRRQGARRSAESRRAPLGIVQWGCCPSASRPRPGACLCLAHRGGRPCLRRRSLCRRLAHTGPCFCSYGLECHVEHPLRVEHPPACAKQSVFAPACAKSRGQLPRAETGGCT